MAGFQLSELSKVYWPGTAKLGLMRGFCSGLVFAMIQLFMAPAGEAGIGNLLILPLAMAVFAIPIGLFCHVCGKVAGMIIPALGAFMRAVGALAVCLGDPLVYLVNRQFPQLLDVPNFGFFNFTPLVIVTDQDSA